MDRIQRLREKNGEALNILLITAVYIATHWFLLAATGRWWDDWAYADRNWDYMIEVFMQSSLPLHAVINAFTWLFPHGFYRILTFVYFYAGAVLLYKILKKTGLFTSSDCVMITVLYIGIPINDARIAWINYAYSFGLFMFFIAFYVAARFKESTGWRRIAFRILSLLLLLISFDTESIMMLTLFVLAYLYHDDFKGGWDHSVRGFIKKLAGSVARHIDFLIAPVAWYFGDKILFPGYGVYGGHSYVRTDSLMGTVVHAPVNTAITLKNILGSYYTALTASPAVAVFAGVLALAVFVISLISGKKNKTDEDSSLMKTILLFLVGAAAFVIGIFPYLVNRDASILNTFTRGRDTMLLGIGTAFMLYYFLRMLLRREFVKPAVAVLAVLASVHFLTTYLEWQESAYQQYQLQHEMAENRNLKDNDTFLIMYSGALINSNYCQTIGNSWEVLGPRKLFYMPGVSGIRYMMNDSEQKERILNEWKMTDYRSGDGVIDGIVFVDYADIGFYDMIVQKWVELTDREAFDAWIDSLRDIRYVPITPSESDKLYELTSEGTLTDEMIYDMYYRK